MSWRFARFCDNCCKPKSTSSLLAAPSASLVPLRTVFPEMAHLIFIFGAARCQFLQFHRLYVCVDQRSPFVDELFPWFIPACISQS
jgi:hypothetical protein